MSYLIDTNIISEVRKGDRCDPHVSAWYDSVADDDLFLSTLVLGESARELNSRVHVILAKPQLLSDGFETLKRRSAVACSALTMRSLTSGVA